MGVVRPYKTRSFNKLGLLTETTILCITTFMVIFTDYCSLPTAQYNLSWICIGCVLLYVLLSFIHMLRKPIRLIYLYLIRYSKIIKFKTSPCWGPIVSRFKLKQLKKEDEAAEDHVIEVIDEDEEEEEIAKTPDSRVNVMKTTMGQYDAHALREQVSKYEDELKKAQTILFGVATMLKLTKTRKAFVKRDLGLSTS
jgi:hypothetical protein